MRVGIARLEDLQHVFHRFRLDLPFKLSDLLPHLPLLDSFDLRIEIALHPLGEKPGELLGEFRSDELVVIFERLDHRVFERLEAH